MLKKRKIILSLLSLILIGFLVGGFLWFGSSDIGEPKTKAAQTDFNLYYHNNKQEAISANWTAITTPPEPLRLGEVQHHVYYAVPAGSNKNYFYYLSDSDILNWKKVDVSFDATQVIDMSLDNYRTSFLMPNGIMWQYQSSGTYDVTTGYLLVQGKIKHLMRGNPEYVVYVDAGVWHTASRNSLTGFWTKISTWATSPIPENKIVSIDVNPSNFDYYVTTTDNEFYVINNNGTASKINFTSPNMPAAANRRFIGRPVIEYTTGEMWIYVVNMADPSNPSNYYILYTTVDGLGTPDVDVPGPTSGTDKLPILNVSSVDNIPTYMTANGFTDLSTYLFTLSGSPFPGIPPFIPPPSGGNGTLVITTNPGLDTLVYIDGNPYTITAGSSGNITLPEGDHYVVFEDLSNSGYTTPEPDGDPSNRDPGNAGDTNPPGRRVFVAAGQTTTMQALYHRDSLLKQIGRTTAETLLFTPSATKGIIQWGLLRGVAEISADGGVNWQKSIAEVLYIGSMPQIFMEKRQSDNTRFLAAGERVEYYIDFSVSDTADLTYNATILDRVTVTPASEASNVIIESASIDLPSVDCAISLASQAAPIIDQVNKTVTYNVTNAVRGCTFRARVVLATDPDIASNVSIQDNATLTTEGATGEEQFTTITISPFTRENLNVGGSIYARGNLNMGDGGGGPYIIGADGNIENNTTSRKGWIVENYTMRSGSSTDFDPDNCVIGSACKTMKDNVEKLKNNYNTNKTLNISINSFDFDGSIPEGDVWYKQNGNITIGSTGSVSVINNGTLLIENGDIFIESNIEKSSSDSMLGIIVHNGNVIIRKNVTRVDALFYIYSDSGSGKGSFITESNSPGYDENQLIINGLVVSSGISSGGTRKDAFILRRNYIGNKLSDLANPANRQPAELFYYDSRVIVNPPPGFSGRLVR
uniref:Uncharacterized protein n=1 Tax=candidate division CPR3 bacterium TaxID=2268181 RepID=A0A7C4M2C6_UNCC3